MARPLSPMNAKIENFIRAEARGESHADILEKVFDLPPGSDIKLIRKAEQKMFHWRHRPDAKAIWEDELSSCVRRRVPGAIKRINAQIDNENDWVANKAANDYIALAKSLGVIKSEETALKVQIEGMPDLGSPDDSE